LSARRRRRAAGERIAELFEQHSRLVYGVCRLILRDPTDAEDAAQQTFLSAYGGLLAGQEPREPSAWLGTIARNECRSRLRSRTTEPLTLVTEPAGDETQREVGRRAEAEALCAALAELPPQQRDAIVLREFYGLSYIEVAAALGLSGAAVESLLFRSRRKLQEELRPLRAALGVLTLPPTLSDSLAQALPGFGGAGAGAGLGVGVLAKLGSAPFAAKLAAATVALGTAGTVAGIERDSQRPAPGRRSPAAASASRVASASLAAPVRVSAPIQPVRATFSETGPGSSAGGGESRHESGSSEPGHESTPAPEAPSREGGSGNEGSSSRDVGSTSSGETGRQSGSGDEHLDGGSSGSGDTTSSGGDLGTSGGGGGPGDD